MSTADEQTDEQALKRTPAAPAPAPTDSSARDYYRRLGRLACREACKEAHIRPGVSGALAEQVAIHLMTDARSYSPRPAALP